MVEYATTLNKNEEHSRYFATETSVWFLPYILIILHIPTWFISVSGFSTPQALTDIVKLLEEKVYAEEFDMPVRRGFTIDTHKHVSGRPSAPPKRLL